MMNKSFPITLERHFNVSADKVFVALTHADTLLEWCGSKGSVSSEIGGKVEMFDGWVTGHVMVYEPNSALAYTWKPNDWDEADPASDVYFTFLPDKDGGTIVTLTHTGFPNLKESDSHAVGWDDYVFKPLEDYFLEQ